MQSAGLRFRYSISCGGCLTVLAILFITFAGGIAGLWWQITSLPSDAYSYSSGSGPPSMEKARAFAKRLEEFQNRSAAGGFEFVIDEEEATSYIAWSLGLLRGRDEKGGVRVGLESNKIDIFWVNPYVPGRSLYLRVGAAVEVRDGRVLVFLERLKMGRLDVPGASGLFKLLLRLARLAGKNRANAVNLPGNMYIEKVDIEDGVVKIEGRIG